MNNQDTLVFNCHQHLLDLYPQLKLRWSKIHGKRWAYFYGNSNSANPNSIRLQISPLYGICIDNSESLNTDEQEKIKILIKKHFEILDH